MIAAASRLVVVLIVLCTSFTHSFSFQNRLALSSQRMQHKVLKGFADPEWNWGYAIGKGHDAAMLLRSELDTVKERHEFIHSILRGASLENVEVDIERIKLALALRFQSARRERLQGADVAYQIMEFMADCKYEGEGISLLKEDLEILLSVAPVVPLPEVDKDINSIDSLMLCCAKALVSMGFIERGL